MRLVAQKSSSRSYRGTQQIGGDCWDDFPCVSKVEHARFLACLFSFSRKQTIISDAAALFGQKITARRHLLCPPCTPYKFEDDTGRRAASGVVVVWLLGQVSQNERFLCGG
jgi:hypothetical protein